MLGFAKLFPAKAWPVQDRCSSHLEWQVFSILRLLALLGGKAVPYLAEPQFPARPHLSASGSAENELSNRRSPPRLPGAAPDAGRRKPASRAPHPFAGHWPSPVRRIYRGPAHIFRHPRPRVRCRTVLPVDPRVPDRDPFSLAPGRSAPVRGHASLVRGRAVPDHGRFASRRYPEARLSPLWRFPALAQNLAILRAHSRPPASRAVRTHPQQ